MLQFSLHSRLRDGGYCVFGKHELFFFSPFFMQFNSFKTGKLKCRTGYTCGICVIFLAELINKRELCNIFLCLRAVDLEYQRERSWDTNHLCSMSGHLINYACTQAFSVWPSTIFDETHLCLHFYHAQYQIETCLSGHKRYFKSFHNHKDWLRLSNVVGPAQTHLPKATW